MSDGKTGGPSFPTLSNEYECSTSTNGMQLHDYFAAKAMQGICADPRVFSPEKIAKLAYLVADAMIAERNKK